MTFDWTKVLYLQQDEQTEQIKEYRNSVSKEIFVKYLKEQKLNKHYNEDGNPSS
jgi:hypothetical protein